MTIYNSTVYKQLIGKLSNKMLNGLNIVLFSLSMLGTTASNMTSFISYSDASPTDVLFCSSKVEPQYFLIKVVEKNNTRNLEKVVVFNDCDASTMETDANGSVKISISEGECCRFTFSKEDYKEQELEVCLNRNKNGQLELSYRRMNFIPSNDLVEKGRGDQSWQSEPFVYKDVEQDLYFDGQSQEAFSGNYKGRTYANGQLLADVRHNCCYFTPKNTDEFTVKTAKWPNPQVATLPLNGQALAVSLEPTLSFQLKGRVLNSKHLFPIESVELVLMENNSPAKTTKQITDLDGTFDFILQKNKCYQLYTNKKNYQQEGERIEVCTHDLKHSKIFEFNVFLTKE